MRIFLSTEEESYSYLIEDKEQVTIGRSESNDFCVPHDELSRHHCILKLDHDELKILDLNSKNGVYVDGLKIPANKDFPLTLQSHIMLSNMLLLSFIRKPGQTRSIPRVNLLNVKLELEDPPVQKKKKR